MLTYIDDASGEKKDLAKHMSSLKFGVGPKIRAILDQLESGDSFYMEQEKKGEYLEITNFAKGEPSIELAQKASETASSGTQARVQASAKNGNTYETPEERKVKQRLIVRQATLNAAIEGLRGKNGALMDNSVDAVIAVASQLENWVYREIE